MRLLLPFVLLSFCLLTHAQEGLPTQLLLTVDSNDARTITANDLTIEVDKHKKLLISLKPVASGGTQIALLIDRGLRQSVGNELDTLRSFITSLPPGTEIFVGHMSNGRVEQEVPFTADRTAAAARLRLPIGILGQSANPYSCLSEFVKHWPFERSEDAATEVKARFVLMITNGIDPYGNSTSPDSPYVVTAVRDAQRAGVPVSSIYYGDMNSSGLSNLEQLAEGSGGRVYNAVSVNPASMEPYLQQFRHDVAETYIATFIAGDL